MAEAHCVMIDAKASTLLSYWYHGSLGNNARFSMVSQSY
jgi:hypothetical protein